MKKRRDNTPSTGSGRELRTLAEARASLLSEPSESLSTEEARTILHELLVHQIELEMQNEELCRTQTELEASQSRYFDLYALAPVGYVTLSEQGLILEANLTAATLLGMTRRELVRQPITRFILTDDQDSYYRHRRQLFTTGEPQVCEVRLRHLDDFFWARLEATAGQDSDGTALYRLVISDITEYKNAEMSRRLTSERLELAQRVARFGVWDWDIITNDITWSTEMFHLFGLDPETATASFETWRGVLHPEDLLAAGRRLEAALLEQTLLVSDYRIITPDQQVRWINATGKVSHVDAGRPGRMIGICVDITERKLAEEILQNREEQFRMMFENHNAVMLLLNPLTGAIIDVNSAAARFYGYDSATLKTKNISDINNLNPEQFKAERLRALHNECNTFIFPHRLAGGDIRMVEVNSSPIEHKGQTILFSIIHDITQKIQAEEQLHTTLAELTRSNEELQQFASVTSHDLREPLRMVASYTQLLARRYEDQLDAEARKFIAYAVEGATRMKRLIDDLLDFSRIGKLGRIKESVPTGELLVAALHNLQAAIEESGAKITHDELPTVWADRSQLVQLFQNLVGNAIKFHCPGEPPRIHVTARCPGHEWQFSVADNGIGIDPQFYKEIFTIFQRLHPREQYPGTGIGLAICKRIVELHGGRIWVESVVGQGATFLFTVPVPVSPRTPPGSGEGRGVQVAGQESSGRTFHAVPGGNHVRSDQTTTSRTHHRRQSGRRRTGRHPTGRGRSRRL